MDGAAGTVVVPARGKDARESRVGKEAGADPNHRMHAGLCADCRWSRRIESSRGSSFWLCRRSEIDTRYRKYPPLPVMQCDGYEEEAGSADPEDLPDPDVS